MEKYRVNLIIGNNGNTVETFNDLEKAKVYYSNECYYNLETFKDVSNYKKTTVTVELEAFKVDEAGNEIQDESNGFGVIPNIIDSISFTYQDYLDYMDSKLSYYR